MEVSPKTGPMNSMPPCIGPQTNAEKYWPYYEYYFGERDDEDRKSGNGQYYWSGAESMESYTGHFLRDTKHGVGEYLCRHRGEENCDRSWEGHYYNNSKHGYGVMSYANGRVFDGFYYNNLRWGPGVETHLALRENVGLWKGDQLVRITWKPPLQSVCPDIMSTTTGINTVANHRILLVAKTKNIGETNSAIELLKQCGTSSLKATKIWSKLYPKNCTDAQSQFFQRDVFDREFYGNTINTLEPIDLQQEEVKLQAQGSITSGIIQQIYYTWNNDANIIHMMRHTYQHDYQLQRSIFNFDLDKILNGPRTHFKPAAQREMDSRTFLLACYLGYTNDVALLINDYDVYPTVTDMQGNSSIMYAACGNQTEIIHFLVEAGAQIDNYNDACCTPLGMIILNFTCARCGILPSKIIQAILPPTVIDKNDVISEWKIVRESTVHTVETKVQTKPVNNKSAKETSTPKLEPGTAVQSANLSKTQLLDNETQQNLEPSEFFSEDKRLYFHLLNDYAVKIADQNGEYTDPKQVTPYIFQVGDMVVVVDLAILEEQKKFQDKKEAKLELKKSSKSMAALALSSLDKNDKPEFSESKIKQMNEMMKTIKQLLSDGADPRLVRCPQPALFMAVVSQSTELVELMIKHGADVNEVYLDCLGYFPLDIAVSKPLSYENLEIINKLLEGGAEVNHKIPIIKPNVDVMPDMPEILGPTLLHCVLAKKTLSEEDEKIRRQLLELLLEYGCDPTIQYRGSSAMDKAMNFDLEMFNIFIESPITNLNAVINEFNQTILVKMFYIPYCVNIPIGERVQMITNLLLYGADPLLKCQNEDKSYDNLFVYAKEALSSFKQPLSAIPSKESKKLAPSKKGKPEQSKKPEKPEQTKKGGKPVKEQSKTGGGKSTALDALEDFMQMLSLVRDCARILYIRWIQAKLMIELVEIVDKYKHRNWIMILKEYKSGKCCGLWLTAIRCLEIWDILQTTKKKVYSNKAVLKSVLCIVHYHFLRRHKILGELTSKAKASIESEVAIFSRDHASSTALVQFSKRPYVKPELTHDAEIEKFNVCFECAIPLNEINLLCGSCKMVHFCSFDCMKDNIDRINCHPCSNYLKKKHFPSSEYSLSEIEPAL